MGWSCGFDPYWDRDIGYGVPATCDHPGCGAKINRGLAYVCGGQAYGGDHGCGLFFCEQHRHYLTRERQNVSLCARCEGRMDPWPPTPDVAEWVHWKLTDDSWQQWRQENPEEAERLKNPKENQE